MGTTYTPETLASGYNITEINAELEAIRAAMDRLLSRYGDTPNSMQAGLDMNSQRVYNLPAPQSQSDALRLADLPTTPQLSASATNTTIVDSGGYYASSNVEGALQEAGATDGTQNTRLTSTEGRLTAIEADSWVTTNRLAALGITNTKFADAGLATSYAMLNGTLVASVATNNLTLAIKTLAGTDPSATDPVVIAFRNTNPALGDYSLFRLTSATSLTITNGSTLGVSTNLTPFRGWIVGFNDAGTLRLGVINCLSTSANAGAGRNADSIYPLAQFATASSTAEGGLGGADSAQVFYTNTAVTNKSFTVLGNFSYETGLVVAGSYASVPDRLGLFRAGNPLPGALIQDASNLVTTVATGSTAIPDDDTIPQITEGDQYMSQAITPVSAANILEIQHEADYAHSGTAGHVDVALFQDATANALATARAGRDGAANSSALAVLRHRMLAAQTTSTTMRIRAGNNTGATTTFNGQAGARKHGGVLRAFLGIREIMS